jgi:cytochrome c-type biogenesis protein CcmE
MREGTEAILEGKYDGQTFEAKNLLLKCPSKYEGEPEEIELQSVK